MVDSIGRKLLKLVFALILCLLLLSVYCQYRDTKYYEQSYGSEQVTSYVSVDENGKAVKVKEDEKTVIKGKGEPDWKKELNK